MYFDLDENPAPEIHSKVRKIEEKGKKRGVKMVGGSFFFYQSNCQV